MKSILLSLTLICGLSPLMAFDAAKLRTDITRDESSSTFSSDFGYVVLEDATVRRVWDGEGSRLSLDFQPRDGSLICGRIRYEKPISISEASRVLNTIAQTTGRGWRKTDKAKIEPLGFQKAVFCMIEDKSKDKTYFFAVQNKSGKVTSINFYTDVPRSNRYALAEGSTQPHRTALGTSSNSSAEQIAYLNAQEAKFKGRRDTAIAAKPIAVDPSKPAQPAAPATEPAEPTAISAALANLGNKKEEEPRSLYSIAYGYVKDLGTQNLLIILGSLLALVILFKLCRKKKTPKAPVKTAAKPPVKK